MTLNRFEFTAQDLPHDYHSPISITLHEAEDAGYINLDEFEWDWYDQEQHDRVIKMIKGRYYDCSVGVLPVTRWVRMFVNRLNESMSKYKPLYAMAARDDFDWLASADEYGKSRDVFSDFPQTLLNGQNQDYASTGTDKQHETRYLGDNMEKYIRYTEAVQSIDVLVVNSLDSMFSSLIAVNVNGF